MTLPKSKMLSASKSIMAIASLKRDVLRQNSKQNQKQEQNQVVNINVQQPEPAQAPVTVHYPTPYEVAAAEINANNDANINSNENKNTLNELQDMLNNSENVARALIMIIDIMQSNPLIVNKWIVPTKQAFIDLVQILTGADDIAIQFNDDIGCFASRKYSIMDDVYVIKNGETQSLKYGGYPDVLRLFDRFNISTKMIATP